MLTDAKVLDLSTKLTQTKVNPRALIIAMSIAKHLPKTVGSQMNHAQEWDATLSNVVDAEMAKLKDELIFNSLEVSDLVRKLHRAMSVHLVNNYVSFYEIAHPVSRELLKISEYSEDDWEYKAFYRAWEFVNENVGRHHIELSAMNEKGIIQYISGLVTGIYDSAENSTMPESSAFRKPFEKAIAAIISALNFNMGIMVNKFNNGSTPAARKHVGEFLLSTAFDLSESGLGMTFIEVYEEL